MDSGNGTVLNVTLLEEREPCRAPLLHFPARTQTEFPIVAFWVVYQNKTIASSQKSDTLSHVEEQEEEQEEEKEEEEEEECSSCSRRR